MNAEELQSDREDPNNT